MKNKSAVYFVLVAFLFVGTALHAAMARSGGKASTTVFGVTGPVSITTGPAVLWAVYLSTGGVFDYTVVFDSGSSNGLTNLIMDATKGYKMRFYDMAFSSFTTIYTLDPPMQFNNGIVAAQSAAAQSSMFVFQRGRLSE